MTIDRTRAALLSLGLIIVALVPALVGVSVASAKTPDLAAHVVSAHSRSKPARRRHRGVDDRRHGKRSKKPGSASKRFAPTLKTVTVPQRKATGATVAATDRAASSASQTSSTAGSSPSVAGGSLSWSGGSSSAASGTSSTSGGSALSTPSVYWGALIGTQFTGDEEPWDMTSVSTLASMVGKGLSLVHFATPFADCESGVCSDESFPWTPLNNIRNYGAIPFLDLESVATQNNSSYSNQLPDTLSAVINGDWDSYLESFAQSAKAWGHPFFLRFDWEMNSSWWPWSEGVNGNTPGQYVAAWRHVHDIFAREGATNVSWVWCPNVDPGNEYTSLQELYPGSAYVDWTCLDGYNTGTNPIYAPYDHWMSFDQLYRSTYDEIVNTIAPGKPMILGEVGSTEIGGSKAQWISQMLSELPSQYPDIHGVIWYDRSTDGWDWPIESSASSLAAFSSGIGNAAYVANNYGNLSSSPIPVP